MLPAMAKQAQRRIARIILTGLGFLSLGVAVVGLVLPGIPTTGPVLLSAYFFSRSSERFDNWLIGHRVFGPIVRDWRAGLGFSRRAKALAIVAIAVTFSVTIVFAATNVIVRVALVVLAVGIAVYIYRLPTKALQTSV
jgi:uncharacterized membrane protein YbaN (DUF454 family)